MRRLTSLLRTPLVLVGLTAAYTAARLAVVAGKTPVIFPDSIGFESLVFLGKSDRMWSIPLFYSVIDNPPNRVIMQVLIGVVAWSFLAWVLSTLSRFPRTIILATFAIGLTPQVVRFDVAMLSESLGISFAVAAVAATLLMTKSRMPGTRYIWLTLVVLTAFTRPIHLVVVFLIATYCALRYIASRRKKMALPALVFVVLSGWGFIQLQGNQAMSTLNLYTVLQQRIIRDDAAYNWFTSNGMPNLPGMRSAVGYNYTWELDPNVAAIVQLPKGQEPPALMKAGGISLANWVRDKGWSTYVRFVQSHPSDVVSLIKGVAPESLSPPNDSFLPVDVSTVMWRNLFGPTWLWLFLLGGFAAAGWLLSQQRAHVRAVTAMAGISVIVFVGIHLTSGIEPQRHSVTSAVLLRVLTLSAFASMAARKGRVTTPGESDAELL